MEVMFEQESFGEHPNKLTLVFLGKKKGTDLIRLGK